MARCAAILGCLLVGLGSGQLNAAEPEAQAADEAPPSAELLMYLAEFGDDSGQVDDPIAVERAMSATKVVPAAKGRGNETSEPIESNLEDPEQ